MSEDTIEMQIFHLNSERENGKLKSLEAGCEYEYWGLLAVSEGINRTKPFNKFNCSKIS